MSQHLQMALPGGSAGTGAGGPGLRLILQPFHALLLHGQGKQGLLFSSSRVWDAVVNLLVVSWEKMKLGSGLITSPAWASPLIFAQAAASWTLFPSKLPCLAWQADERFCKLVPSLGQIQTTSGWICSRGEHRGSLQAGEGGYERAGSPGQRLL